MPFLLSHVAAGVDKVGGDGISCQAAFQAGRADHVLEGRMVRVRMSMWVSWVNWAGPPHLSERPGQVSQVRVPHRTPPRVSETLTPSGEGLFWAEEAA